MMSFARFMEHLEADVFEFKIANFDDDSIEKPFADWYEEFLDYVESIAKDRTEP